MHTAQIDEVRSWAVAAGDLALQYFNRAEARRKADHSWVTEADEAIERQLVELVSARFPDHGIIGEEQTRRQIDREFVWAIDPLDGTASFVSGLPIWGVSIGLLRHGQPYLGVIYLPVLRDCYWMVPGGGAYLNDQPIQVISPPRWDGESWLATPANSHRRFNIDFVGKTRTLGSTAAAMCYVARGSATGALITTIAIWDVAAGLAIVQAAGGVTLALSGQPIDAPSMLNGKVLETPLLVAAPGQIERFQASITERAS